VFTETDEKPSYALAGGRILVHGRLPGVEGTSLEVGTDGGHGAALSTATTPDCPTTTCTDHARPQHHHSAAGPGPHRASWIEDGPVAASWRYPAIHSETGARLVAQFGNPDEVAKLAALTDAGRSGEFVDLELIASEGPIPTMHFHAHP